MPRRALSTLCEGGREPPRRGSVPPSVTLAKSRRATPYPAPPRRAATCRAEPSRALSTNKGGREGPKALRAAIAARTMPDQGSPSRA